MPKPCHDSRHWFPTVALHQRRDFLHSKQQGIYIQVSEKKLINFASNDYLGLRQHPDIQNAAIDTIQSEGLGSGASRLVAGDSPISHQLEQELATWKGFEACLTLGSGMLANIGLTQALADRHTHIFSDKLNHASLLDGVRLSGAKAHRFAHKDYAALEALLKKNPAEKRLIISDGVFSMDGDCADVSALLRLSETYDCLLLMDDAHGTGCTGEGFRGLSASIAGHPRLIEVGTFGKAFGGYGAFILGCHELIDGLKQRMRTMIYSTALPTAIPAAMLAALKIIQQGEVQQPLQNNLALFQELSQGLNLLNSKTAIQACILGSNEAALTASKQLREQGFFVPAIRPPTVPKNTARLRITLSSSHSHEHIHDLCQALKSIT